MVRKKLAVAVLALSALQANFADAMGLGSLSIRSALNQPLNAEIKLLDTGDLDPTQIKIQLAAPEDFQRAGVDREFFLTNLRFSVDMDGHGGGTIKVTTREPVVEPYLNFVLEARWPNGRLLREFAVLLDPPTFSANKTATPVTPATTSTVAQPAKSQAVQPPTVKTETQAATTVPSADTSLPAAGKPGEYRVQVYDTLSKIAGRFKPASDVSMVQTMIAIQRANPQVFIRNNINLIKSGYVLRLPTADEVRTIAADQAAQEVDAQTQEWHGSRSVGTTAKRAPAAGPQLDASAPEPSKKEGGFHEQARLSVATSGNTDKSAVGGSGSGKGLDALRQQLTESQESLEKGKRDNKELQSKLDDMDRQMATLQRLISLKDEQLAAVQSKAALAKVTQQQSTPSPEKVVPTPTPATAGTAGQAAPAATTSVPAEAAAPVTTTTTAVPEPKTTLQPVPVAAKPSAPIVKPSAVDQIVANPTYYLYGGVGAMLLGLVIAFVAKRRKAAAEEQADSDSLSFDGGDNYQFDTDALGEADNKDVAAVAEAQVAEAAETEQSVVEPPQKAVRSETGDPIAESDIYIAYGRYQQAVDLLTHAVDAEPNRTDLRVKLLEVYVEMRNKDAFRQQFLALQDLGDSGAVARVKDLLSSVDGVSNWITDLPISYNTSPFTADTPAVAPSAATAAIATSTVSAEPDLDLDLNFDNEPAPDESSVSTTSFDGGWGEDLAALNPNKGSESSAELELDLDLDDDELVLSEPEASISEEFLNESAPASDFSAVSFETSHEPVKADGNSVTVSEEDGLDLDLGDDDFDQVLSRMDDADSLGDLDEISTDLGDLGTQPVPAPVDLNAEFGELPEEFDLSQPTTELPEVDRVTEGDFGDLSFDEPSFESEPEPEPEMDVFAGLNQANPAPIAEPAQPIAAASALDSGDDFDFLADADEVATKLDLARAYIDMGDTDGAKDILDEVLQEGTDTQKDEASTLLSRIG